MTFDGIITKCVISELNNNIINGKIERVTMPSKNEIYMYIYNAENKGKYILCINCNANEARINLTTFVKSIPATPPTFCMVMRKYLLNNRIISISQYMLDRIIQIEFEGYNEMNDLERKYLYIELMGKHSNCILTNENAKIIDSLKHIDDTISSVRMVLPGIQYDYPKTKNDFLALNFDSFIKIISSNTEISISETLLNNFNGFSNKFISLALDNVQINNELNISDISKDKLLLLYNYINSCYTRINENNFSISDENTNDMYINFTNAIPNSINISKSIDNYYISKDKLNILNNNKNTLLKVINNIISKDNKNLKILYKNLSECEKINTYKIYGELLNANMHNFDKSNNLEYIVVNNYYDNNYEFKIPLDKTISLSKNAQKYFKKYSKLKNTYTYSISQKDILENEISYLESVIYNIENCNNLNDLQLIKSELVHQKYYKEKTNLKKNSIKKENKDSSLDIRPIKYIYHDYEIYIGKNNIQNDYLTHKFAKSNDMWLHAQKIHGSHVIIKNKNEEIPNDIIEFSSSLSAFYSKASNATKVNVDFTYIKYVKKHTSNKPGMVVYTDFKTITISPNKHEKYMVI